jgi:protocatechuate 3,4-dioxygenase alpha subunit
VIFFDDGEGNDTDPIVASIGSSLRERMLAVRDGPARYRFDIVLRGARESIFFDD